MEVPEADRTQKWKRKSEINVLRLTLTMTINIDGALQTELARKIFDRELGHSDQEHYN